METSDWMRALLVAALVVVLTLRTRSWLRYHRRHGIRDCAVAQDAYAIQEGVVGLASERGWDVRRGEAASAAFPIELYAPEADVGACDLAVTGEDFIATSWTAYTAGRWSPLQHAFRLHVVQVNAPAVHVDVLVRDRPVSWTPLLYPARFHGSTSKTAPARLLAAGDYDRAQERLAPLEERIVDSQAWVVVLGGVVSVMAHWEPGAVELERRVRLARDIAAALS